MHPNLRHRNLNPTHCTANQPDCPVLGAGREGLAVADLCRRLGSTAKRFDKRLKFWRERFGVAEVDQQVPDSAT